MTSVACGTAERDNFFLVNNKHILPATGYTLSYRETKTKSLVDDIKYNCKKTVSNSGETGADFMSCFLIRQLQGSLASTSTWTSTTICCSMESESYTAASTSMRAGTLPTPVNSLFAEKRNRLTGWPLSIVAAGSLGD